MLRLGYRPEPPAPPPPPPRGAWQRFAEAAAPSLMVGLVLFGNQAFRDDSKEVTSKINALREALPAILAKLDDICKRETKNRENDEKYRDVTDEHITELKEEMARVKQQLKLSPP